ncbi:MAG: hypothetical protein ABH952_04585 [Candidatus Omnitrophota bacterium]
MAVLGILPIGCLNILDMRYLSRRQKEGRFKSDYVGIHHEKGAPTQYPLLCKRNALIPL